MTTGTSATATPPRPLPLVLSALAFLYVLIAAFPGTSVPGSGFLDGAWVLEVNRLSVGGFGSEVAFTYGPLGFLLYPTTSAGHVVLAALLRAASLAALAAWAWDRGTVVDRLLFAVAQVVAVRLGLTFEYHLLVPVFLLAARSLDAPPGAIEPRLVILAALAGTSLFVKFSLGAAFGSVVAAVWVVRVFQDRRRALRPIAASAAVGAGVILLLAALFLRHATELFAWIGRSLDLANGYSEAMSLASPVPGSVIYGWMGGLSVALVAALGAWGVARGSRAGAFLLVVAGPAFLAFKHAFVRQDALHTTLFFPFLLASATAALLVAAQRHERLLLRTAVALTAALSVLVGSAHHLIDGQGRAVARALVGQDGLGAIGRWLSVKERQEELSRALVPMAPPGLAEVAAGRPIGVVPFQLGFCAVPGVTCTPNPTLQTFAAYTARLDRWTGEHYLGAAGPHLVLLHLDGIDGRSPALDSPELWRALIAAYRASPVQLGGALLLERVAVPARPELIEVARQSIEAERWAEVPDRPGPLYAALALELTLAGRLQKAAFAIGPVYLGLRYRTGQTVAFRIVPATASSGLPIDQLPLGPVDLYALFRGERLPRPFQVALLGEGLSAYSSGVELRWLTTN